MPACLISLGSNLGDCLLAIDSAVEELRTHPAIQLRRVSPYHSTQSIGGPADQPEFVNAAALVETSLPPRELLHLLLALETRAGRTRGIRWGPRSLDLDLLLYGNLVIHDPQLAVPHPRMAFRRFVLVPAAEIAPKMVHPLLGRSIAQLLNHLNEAQNYVAITGVPGVGKTRLAELVASRVGAMAIIESSAAGQSAARSASRSLQAELELFNRRCELLRGYGPSRDKPYAISDFWLEQSLVYAKELSSDVYRQVEAAWLSCRHRVAAPKLMVLVETTLDEATRDEVTQLAVARQRSLLERMAAPGQPPMLRLNASNVSWNEEEVAAAILTM